MTARIPAVKTWWVVVMKNYATDEMHGPYFDENTALHEMEFSPEIDYSCQEDCVDCFLEEHMWILGERRFKGQHRSTYLKSTYLGRDVIVIFPESKEKSDA